MASTVFNPDAHPESTSVDGSVARLGVDETWSTIRGGAGTSAGDSSASVADPTIKGSTTANQFQRLSRGVVIFDTNSIPAGSTIDSATLEIYVTAVDSTFSDLDINISNLDSIASDTAIANGDYAVANYGSDQLATAIALSAFTTSAYNTFTLNATGLTKVIAAGITRLAIRWDKDITNTAITHAGTTNESTLTWQTADGANPPKLTVVYTAPPSVTKNYATFI